MGGVVGPPSDCFRILASARSKGSPGGSGTAFWAVTLVVLGHRRFQPGNTVEEMPGARVHFSERNKLVVIPICFSPMVCGNRQALAYEVDS